MEQTPTARVIITEHCLRQCKYCVNRYEKIMKSASEISHIKEIAHFPCVCITGGEPALNIQRTSDLLTILQNHGPRNQRRYLYSAWYRTSWLTKVVDKLHGIHFTLHAKSTRIDTDDFYTFQADAALFPKLSYRLYIHPQIRYQPSLISNVWSRVEVKPWLTEENCCLPAHEKLFILREKFNHEG